MIRRLIVFLCLAVLAVIIGRLKPVAASDEPTPRQMIASVVLHQNTNEARVTLSVVDLGPSKKYGRGIFRSGVIIADDAGRMIAIRGMAEQVGRGTTYQIFQIDDAQIDMPGMRVIRVTHISLLVFSGDDWQHPYETTVCSSPSLSIDVCLAEWHTDD